MEETSTITIPKRLKYKIQRAAIANNMKPTMYLDSIVPEIKMEEIKCQNL